MARRAQGHADRSVGDLKSDEGLVTDAMAQLSDRHRDIIYRSYRLGRTTSQIAADLQTDDHLVKQELHHALHALRTTLQNAGTRSPSAG